MDNLAALRRDPCVPPAANDIAKKSALSLVVGTAPALPIAADSAVCIGECDLDGWFAREILPLEPMLLSFLRRRWRDSSEIADLQQEAYIRICQAARRARPLQTKSFLFLVVRNLMIDRLRQKNVVSIETMSDMEWMAVSDNEPTPEDHVASRQELQVVQNALSTLPGRCREVVLLRKVQGHSQREVARRMGITEETVEHQLAKGLRVLMLALSRLRPARGAKVKRLGRANPLNRAAKPHPVRQRAPIDVHVGAARPDGAPSAEVYPLPAAGLEDFPNLFVLRDKGLGLLSSRGTARPPRALSLNLLKVEVSP